MIKAAQAAEMLGMSTRFVYGLGESGIRLLLLRIRKKPCIISIVKCCHTRLTMSPYSCVPPGNRKVWQHWNAVVRAFLRSAYCPRMTQQRTCMGCRQENTSYRRTPVLPRSLFSEGLHKMDPTW